MPKVTAEYREARRDEIIDAALRAFSAKGLSGTSMADVIAESGLSAGAIYGHFAGKRELFAAVAVRTLQSRRLEVDAQQAGGHVLTPGEVVATVLRGMRDSFDTRLLVQLWADAAADPTILDSIGAPLGFVLDAFGASVRPWFEAHPECTDGDTDAAIARLVPIMLALGQGFMIQRQIFAEFDDEAYLASVREILPH
ncbi:TetR/AcrR family transcriptional regulator [Agromyces laixinhei]|uniref:TetR/AcrR family transcriptional regulator n=1 Tax=Agromyces laixinhei TaxID=2585717 RepID=UPI0011175F1A|nr:TetR/AcrR family transcriptional regulator [Agromyces laixinhei]